MSKRQSSSVILHNLKKRDLPQLGQPTVSFYEAEQRLSVEGTVAESDEIIQSQPENASQSDSSHDSYQPLLPASPPAISSGTRLRPRERAARSALIVRLDPGLHRRLDDVARHNRLTMNDIVTEAIETHLKNFAHPPGYTTA